MTGRRLIPAVLAMWLVLATMAAPGPADAQSTDSRETERARIGYRFSYTPIYQFETDWTAAAVSMSSAISCDSISPGSSTGTGPWASG